MSEPTKEQKQAICMSELDLFYEMSKECIEKNPSLMQFFATAATHFLSQAIMICEDEVREVLVKNIISRSLEQGMMLQKAMYERD